MSRAKASAVAALLLSIVACDSSTTAPLSSIEASAVAAKGDVAVVSEIQGTGLSILSDGSGQYQNGVSGVVSIIQGIGDWELDLTGRRSTRRVSVSLADSLPGNPAAAPFSSATVPARFIAKASELGGKFTTMVGVGSTIQTPLSIGQIAYGGKTYAIRMNANNHPATEWALVTCIRVTSTNACNQWRLTPSAVHDGASKNIGRLEEVGTSTTFLGNYYFSFDIVVTR